MVIGKIIYTYIHTHVSMDIHTDICIHYRYTFIGTYLYIISTYIYTHIHL